jgi:hypothetical protein
LADDESRGGNAMLEPQLDIGKYSQVLLAREEKVGEDAENREGVGMDRLDVASGMPTRCIVESPFWQPRLALRE